MNNNVTETTTDSPSKQGSVKRRPKLYTGIAALTLIVVAAGIVGAKLSHDAQFTAAVPKVPTSTSVNRCSKSSTDGCSSSGISRPWIK